MSSPVTILGTARVRAVTDFEGNSDFELDFSLIPDSRTIIAESHVLFMAQGGYVLDYWNENGSLFKIGPDLNAATPVSPSRPAARAISLIAVHTSAHHQSSASILRRNLQQIPVACDSATGWTANIEARPLAFLTSGPPQIPVGDIDHGLMIGLMGPVDVMDIIEPKMNAKVVRRTLILSGHFINLFRDPRFAEFLANPQKDSLDRWHVTLRDHGSGQVVLDENLAIRDDWPGFKQNSIFGTPPDGRFGVFHYALRVPTEFTFGLLRLELKLQDMEAIYETEVQLVTADVLHLPLAPTDALFRDATINFGNGPAEPGVISTPHNGDMTQRYAYDLGVYVNNSAIKPTMSGNTLDSFWSFGQPIVSVADGVVIRVRQDLPDSMPGVGGEINKIVVQHEHAVKPRYSVYAHIRQNTAVVRVGDRVAAGQQLAQVGCNGPSGAPHLHLAYYEFDDWGVLRMLPMAFTVSDGSTGSVSGVPRSDQRLQAPAGLNSGSNRGFLSQLVDFVVEVITVVGDFIKNIFSRR